VFTFTVINSKALLKGSLAAVCAGEIPQGGTARGNGFIQDITDMAHKIIETGIMANLANQRSSLAPGRKRAAIQNFIDINVPEARDDPLIKQGSLQGC
jgi:hypothetical protein